MVSNSNLVLEGLQNFPFSLRLYDNPKKLGLQWCPNLDFLQYSIKALSLGVSTRTIISGIVQIFDPPGLLDATIIIFKILMRFWLEKLRDESIRVS